MRKIFISYNRSDTEADANALYQFLRTRFGPEKVYKDVHDIPLGSTWRDEVVIAVESSAVMLVLIGPQWTMTEAIGLELATAIEAEIPVVPLLVRGANLDELTADLEMPQKRIAEAHGASLRHSSWDRDLVPIADTINGRYGVEYREPRQGEVVGNETKHSVLDMSLSWPPRRTVVLAALSSAAIGVIAGRTIGVVPTVTLGALGVLVTQFRHGLDVSRSRLTMSVGFVALLIAGAMVGTLGGRTEDVAGVDSPAGPDQSASDASADDGRGPDTEIGEFCAEAQTGNRVLSGSDLRGCKLDNTDLSEMDLSSTNLSGASLRNADLSRSVLNRTDLRGADLTGAIMTGAHFYRVQLGDAEGLDEIDWSGVLVERSICQPGIQCEFPDAITINSSLVECVASDYALGSPIASVALDKPLLWQDEDQDCLHDEFERANGTLLGNPDTDGDSLVDGIDGHGGDETPLSLFEQFRIMN